MGDRKAGQGDACIPCAQTASDLIGGSCTTATTADAVIPGVVKEGVRAVWQLGRVNVYDGGADGDADTSPNERFLVQGVFIP